MAGLAKPLYSTVCCLLGGTIAVMWGSDIRGRSTGRVGVVEEIKEPGEAEERKESRRAQGPLVKHKGRERERTFEVRVKLQVSTP